MAGLRARLLTAFSPRARAATLAATVLALTGAVFALSATHGAADVPRVPVARAQRRPARPTPARPATATASTFVPRELLTGFSPLEHHVVDGRAVSELPGGKRAVLTIDPQLQAFLESTLDQYEVPWAAVVAMEPATGRVLAYVSHSSANPDAGDLVLDPTPPAASVFKVITGTALVDRGTSPATRVCYGGGQSRLTVADLTDDPRRDRTCATLADAMGGSINAIFAKLADRHLDAPTLDRFAGAYGFGHALPFDVATRPSPAEIPTDRLEFARTAAGFWHMHMSPLHAALIASTVANEGRMPRAFMVEQVQDADGNVLARATPQIFRAVVGAETARQVNRMMRLTVTQGTARRSFHDPAGLPFLPGVEIAGKTGTLNGSAPFRAYTWWVGFAPADHPTIAVAALVVNTPAWRIKASYVAREALRYRLIQQRRR